MNQGKYDRINENIKGHLENTKIYRKTSLVTLGGAVAMGTLTISSYIERQNPDTIGIGASFAVASFAVSAFFAKESWESQRMAHNFELVRESHRLNNSQLVSNEQAARIYDQDKEIDLD